MTLYVDETKEMMGYVASTDPIGVVAILIESGGRKLDQYLIVDRGEDAVWADMISAIQNEEIRSGLFVEEGCTGDKLLAIAIIFNQGDWVFEYYEI